MATYKLGDRVRLKSGGPLMTVVKVYSDTHILFAGEVKCEWMDGDGRKQQRRFRSEMLMPGA